MDLALENQNKTLQETEKKQLLLPKTTRLVLNMIYSLALFGGLLYAALALNKHIITTKGSSIYEALYAVIHKEAAHKDMSPILSLLIKNFNAETFSEITTSLIMIASIMIIAVLFLTFVYNAMCIIFYKQLSENGEADNQQLLKGIRIMNIGYCVITYISIFTTLIAVIFPTVILGTELVSVFEDDFLNKGPEATAKACKIFIIICYAVLFFVATALIIKKCDRISKTPNYVYYENLGTYLLGLSVTFIPLLIVIAIMLLIVRFILSFGFRSSD